MEFLCNECCWFGCRERRACYEAVSRKISVCPARSITAAPRRSGRYRFSRAMANPGFIGIKAIQDTYLPGASPNSRSRGAALAVR